MALTPLQRICNRIQNKVLDSEEEWNNRKKIGNYRDSERVPTRMECPGTQERACSVEIRRSPFAKEDVFYCDDCNGSLRATHKWDEFVELFFTFFDSRTHKLITTREDWRHHGLEKNNFGRSQRSKNFCLRFLCLVSNEEDTVRILGIADSKRKTCCNYCDKMFSDRESAYQAMLSNREEKEKEKEDEIIDVENVETKSNLPTMEEISDLLAELAVVDKIREQKGFIIVDFTCANGNHTVKGKYLKNIEHSLKNNEEICSHCCSNGISMSHLSEQIRAFLKENSHSLTLLDVIRKEKSNRFLILHCAFCDTTFERKYDKRRIDQGQVPRCNNCSGNNFALLKKEVAETNSQLISPKSKEEFDDNSVIKVVCSREGCGEIAEFTSLRAFKNSVRKVCQKCWRINDDQQKKLERALEKLQDKGIKILNRDEIVNTKSHIVYRGHKSGFLTQTCELKSLLGEYGITLSNVAKPPLTVENLKEKFGKFGLTLLDEIPGTIDKEYDCECRDCKKEYTLSVKRLKKCICKGKNRAKYSMVVEKFKNDNCELLTEEKDFSGQDSSLNFNCWCGTPATTNWKRAQNNRVSCGKHRAEIRMATNKKKYGVENQFQREEVKEKTKETLEKKYGVSHNMQSAIVFEKMEQTSAQKRKKQFSIPGYKGNISSKYEAGFITEMMRYNIKFISNKVEMEKKIGKIWYVMDGKRHTYFPDFYLPEKKKIIEIKSWWAFEREEAINIAKWNHLADNDYDFEIWFYDGEGCHTHTLIFEGDKADYKIHMNSEERNSQIKNILNKLTQ